jgi:hypothetical protein
MPFGLAYTSAIFQKINEKISYNLIDQGVVAYIDDIVIYYTSQEEHKKLFKQVLIQIQKWNHVALLEKYKFH